MKKTILGLDLGTNSIGWALVGANENNQANEILGMGSRVIPMTQDTLGKFDSGVSLSQTAERTGFRGVRRIKERHLLRRERLHRVLNILNFLPKHYKDEIDFLKKLGKYKTNSEPKLCYRPNINEQALKENKLEYDFLFKKSFLEMVEDFKKTQAQLFYKKSNGKETKIPYDWTIYYLRKKALTTKIEKEELAWLLLHFNQKRGYYQLRGEEEQENKNKLVEYYSLLVTHIEVDQSTAKKDEKWYHFHLENGWVYKRSSKTLLDWTGKVKDFIVTTDLNDDGSIKKDKDGKEKRSFRAPSDDDWTLLKKKTEKEIEHSKKTVGTFIYDSILQNPNQKINGQLVRTIERKFYKEELQQIIDTQIKFHLELQDKIIYKKCCEELYEMNEGHRNHIAEKGFAHLFINDIIFYQRPLKSQKSQISDCRFEKRAYIKEGKLEFQALKSAPKSHPLFQEFRLIQFIQNLRIYKKEDDKDVTIEFLSSPEHWEALFDWLNNRKEIDQKAFLKYPPFNLKKNAELYRWNYVEDKFYPCNETRSLILSRFDKLEIEHAFLTSEIEESLWHILYSVTDKNDLEKALSTFVTKNDITHLKDDFIKTFVKHPPYKSEYAAYSIKAFNKMLPLMRFGKKWDANNFHHSALNRIEKIINGEVDVDIKDRVREKAIHITELSNCTMLPLWLTSYIVYDRHSEDGEVLKWKLPLDIENYLRNVFKQHSLRNPIVEQIISETLRVVTDIWKYYGEAKENFFTEIHVELGREMKNPADKRKQISENNTINENSNLRIKAMLMEFLNDKNIENVRPYSPSQQELLKLYEEGVLNAESEIPEDILKITKLAQPSSTELSKYKLWLDQKYRSPYTGEVIPLNKLFTPAYEIEHIIPQSRYFDDSFSNKIICEAAVNKDKDNKLALEYITSEGGKIIEIGNGKKIKVFKLAQYEEFVKQSFAKNKSKMKKLLMDDIPEAFIQRQLNDSRYISKVVKNLLSNIVREEQEQESVSKNLLSTNGAITSILKQDWGLNEIWNEIISPRFERLNQLSNSKNFGDINPNTKKFLPQVPLELQKGFNKKRIDHRHHALDALVIACATRSHINYLNNESALGKESQEIKEKKRFDLRHKLCTKKFNEGSDKNYKWVFNSPWQRFAKDAKDSLEKIVVSFKQNTRVINKTVNYYKKLELDENGVIKKVFKKQVKGENWAIRKPMHKDTVSGKVDLPHVKLPKGKFLTATRKTLDTSFDIKTIESITDTGIQKILKSYLQSKGNNPELAFSPEGIEDMNKDIKKYNDGKDHKPILKVRVFELGSKFNVGQNGNKSSKFVEAAQGTNLYFAIYEGKDGKRNFETVSLITVIDRLKKKLSPVPEFDINGNQFLMWLSPNDLIYLPTEDEKNNISAINFSSIDKEKLNRIWNVNDFSSAIYFQPNSLAKNIAPKEVDMNFDKTKNKITGSFDTKTASFEGKQIKDHCIKLNVDRLGNIEPYPVFNPSSLKKI